MTGVKDRFPEGNDPQKNPVLFHYCSIETLISFANSRNLWLSDLNTMNDFAESHWGYARYIEAVHVEMHRLDMTFIDKLDEVLSTTQLRILPFMCSFSTDGDVLSQWRAYADDGRGVALGLDAEGIERLSVRSVEIEYDKKAQVDYFRRHLLAMQDVYHELPDVDKRKFLVENGSYMGVDFCCFKNPAFSEEKEVRIIRAMNVEQHGDKLKITDNGGSGADKLSRKKLPIKFRARHGGIVCYVELPLTGLGQKIIKKVVIGPKSPNSGVEIETLLLTAGFEDFQVVHSTATYR